MITTEAPLILVCLLSSPQLTPLYGEGAKPMVSHGVCSSRGSLVVKWDVKISWSLLPQPWCKQEISHWPVSNDMERRTALLPPEECRIAICPSGLECLLIRNGSHSPLPLWLPVGGVRTFQGSVNNPTCQGRQSLRVLRFGLQRYSFEFYFMSLQMETSTTLSNALPICYFMSPHCVYNLPDTEIIIYQLRMSYIKLQNTSCWIMKKTNVWAEKCPDSLAVHW